jgi:predicted dehydrogenase
MSLGLGVIGCGSVFAGPYRAMIDRLRAPGRVHVSAVYDLDDTKRRRAAAHYAVDPDLAEPAEVIGRDDVDVVLVLTSMNEHGRLAKAALEAGKHVLVEKPLATSLDEAAELLERSRTAPGLLVCAPHILLSPTFRAVHAAVREGRIGALLSARAR